MQWFFKKGALAYSTDSEKGKAIDYQGSKLPSGGTNDGAYWIDLPTNDDARNNVKKGDIESAELYVHVKTALGGAKFPSSWELPSGIIHTWNRSKE